MSTEPLEIVDEQGRVLGIAARNVIHGDPSKLHRVVHVLVFNSAGALLLQRRSMQKDVAPGKWDTSVGGHVDPGESLELAAMREMREELGIKASLRFLYSYIHSNPYESELVNTYMCIHDGQVNFNPEEIDEVRHWSIDEIESALSDGVLSDNFKHEIRTYLERLP